MTKAHMQEIVIFYNVVVRRPSFLLAAHMHVDM